VSYYRLLVFVVDDFDIHAGMLPDQDIFKAHLFYQSRNSKFSLLPFYNTVQSGEASEEICLNEFSFLKFS
jgi:hypothetical protein